MNKPHLVYFEPVEFMGWWDRMSPRLVVLLDSLRHQWGVINISTAPGAVGRMAGSQNKSQHNAQLWGEVRAVDVFPSGIASADDADRFVRLAADVGFTGIGLYPMWRPSVGVHLDVRENVRPGRPAKWGKARDDRGDEVVMSLSAAMEMIG